ncbi:MAG TPA: hypothetical protein VGX71_19085 [Pseudaminobacter sp.]|nr:hypothetical protein [Pseudaminobacter sp.]
MFVAEALSVVGQYLAAEAWTGDEYWWGYREDAIPNLPLSLDQAGEYHRRNAWILLRRFRETIAPENVDGLTDGLWHEALGAHQEYTVHRAAARRQIADARAFVRDRCAHGQLVGAIRYEYNGEFAAIKAERWNTGKYNKWLRDGKVCHEDIFSSYGGSPSRDYSYLFIEKHGLADIVTASPVETEGHYLSSYMKLMLRVSNKLGMSRENQLTKAEIEAELVAMSKLPGMPIISQSLAESAATLMREFESQSGSKAFHEGKKRQKSG